MPAGLIAIGADGARGGWVAVSCFEPGIGAPRAERRTEIALCPTFASLLDLRGDSQAVLAADIPMGLLDRVDLRPCERQARALLGRRRTTVFIPPSRPLLEATTYAAARGLVATLRETDPGARSLSAQAFGLVPKVREVDAWLRAHPEAQTWLFECHPELSFMAMGGGRMLDDKKTAYGQAERVRLVVQAFPDALEVMASTPLRAREGQLADVLDAYAALHSALRAASGRCEVLGGETDGAGLAMRIVI